MIYLIGVDHKIQHNGNGCADLFLRNKFSAFLKDKIQEYNITLLAEEFNEDCLKNSKANIATIKSVAEESKIEHRFCELSENERKKRKILSSNEIYSEKLNIHSYNGSKPNLNKEQQEIFDEEMEKSFLQRETEWFCKIRDDLDRNILFVCGSDHIKSFKTLLIGKGYKPMVLILDRA
jgi:hypothetical protein